MKIWVAWDAWHYIITSGTTFEILKKHLIERLEATSKGYIDNEYISLHEAYGSNWKHIITNIWEKENFEDFFGDPHEFCIEEVQIYDA